MNAEKLLDELVLCDLLLSTACCDGANRKRVVDSLNAPEWDETGRVHDWRNYIDDAVQDHWDQFPMSSKIAMYINAENMAGREEWD